MFTWRQNSPRLLQLIEQLERLGYFRYVAPDKVRGVKSSFMKKPSLSSLQVNRDFYFPESRACALATFIRPLFPILKDDGIQIKEIEEYCSRDGHWIVIDGQRYELALRDFLADPQNKYNLAEHKTPRSFAIINKLFEGARSDERVYYYNGRHFHRAYVMPTTAYDLLMQYKIEGANDLVLFNPSDTL